MTQKRYSATQRMPSHPGAVLKSGFMETYQLSIETVADLLGITRVHLSRVLNAHSPVTSDIAIKLELLTKVSASTWLSLQAKYDSYRLAQDRQFMQYRKMLEEWSVHSLEMPATARRGNSRNRELACKAGALARCIGKKPLHASLDSSAV